MLPHYIVVLYRMHIACTTACYGNVSYSVVLQLPQKIEIGHAKQFLARLQVRVGSCNVCLDENVALLLRNVLKVVLKSLMKFLPPLTSQSCQ